jgi:flagellar biogenesis protein FliO
MDNPSRLGSMLETTSTNQFTSLVLAVVIVAFAIALFAALAFYVKRKFNINSLGLKLNPQARLSVIETVHIDQKRKLILIQKDGIEHLIMVGGPSDLVIDTHTASSKNQAIQTDQQLTGRQQDPSITSAISTAGPDLTDPNEHASQPTLQTEEEAIDFFDKARDRIFSQQKPELKTPNRPKPRDDTDDFHAILQSQQGAEPKKSTQAPRPAQAPVRRRNLEPIPDTADERVNKLKALLDEAQRSRDKRQ